LSRETWLTVCAHMYVHMYLCMYIVHTLTQTTHMSICICRPAHVSYSPWKSA